jgi:hypothetical protein
MGILLLALLVGGFTAPRDEVLIDQIPPPLGVGSFHKLAVDLPLGVLHGYILPRQRVGWQDIPPEQHSSGAGTMEGANETDTGEQGGSGKICHL